MPHAAPPFTALPPRLVVPVDFSAPATDAARYAAALGHRVPDTRLHLLHVLEEDEGDAASLAVKERLVALAEAAGLAGSTAPTVKLAQRAGEDAAETVVAYAEEIGADLIVTSRTGARGWRRLALGREADTLVRTAHTPILVLPDEAPPHADVRVVAVGVDLGPGDAALVAAARAFAARYGAPDGVRVVLVHAIEPLPYPASLVGPMHTFDPSIRGAIEAEVTALAGTVGAESSPAEASPAEVVVEDGAAAGTLVRVAERIRADVIVVAPSTQGVVERWMLGSVAERVVRTATRPVLVVRHAPGAGA